jgi:hypothetical protein
MTQIGDYHAAAATQLPVTLPPRVAAAGGTPSVSTSLAPQVFSLRGNNFSADELRNQFTQFVGETFYGQMIKAMRSTVGKPAYFHGGRGEEVFQGQLDQQLAEYMTAASADALAGPMFARQFPQFAEQPERQALDQLARLPRR